MPFTTKPDALTGWGCPSDPVLKLQSQNTSKKMKNQRDKEFEVLIFGLIRCGLLLTILLDSTWGGF